MKMSNIDEYSLAREQQQSSDVTIIKFLIPWKKKQQQQHPQNETYGGYFVVVDVVTTKYGHGVYAGVINMSNPDDLDQQKKIAIWLVNFGQQLSYRQAENYFDNITDLDNSNFKSNYF